LERTDGHRRNIVVLLGGRGDKCAILDGKQSTAAARALRWWFMSCG
jgi:hypothetical protein